MTQRASTAVGAGLQLASQASVNFGSSVAGLVIPVVGSPVVVAARQLVAAIVLVPLTRPRVRGRTFRELWPAIALGIAIAVMNLAFFEAVGRIGVGPSVTIEYLGPLAIALLGSRRLLDVVCAIAAGAGVYLLVGFEGDFDPLGIAFAATAGACWAAYILLTRKVSAEFRGLEGLAIASTIAVALTLPLGLFLVDFSEFAWPVIGLLFAVGLLSSAIPYSLDFAVLRRISPRLYSIITALAPAIAVLAGWIVLGEALTPLQLVAVGVVCVAAATAIGTARPRRTSTLEETATDIP